MIKIAALKPRINNEHRNNQTKLWLKFIWLKFGIVFIAFYSQHAFSVILSGEINLPSGQIANGSINNEVQLCRYDNSGN